VQSSGVRGEWPGRVIDSTPGGMASRLPGVRESLVVAGVKEP
jgi:hypothetical protein